MFLTIVSVLGLPKRVGGLTSNFLCGRCCYSTIYLYLHPPMTIFNSLDSSKNFAAMFMNTFIDLRNDYSTQFSIHLNIRYMQYTCNVGYIWVKYSLFNSEVTSKVNFVSDERQKIIITGQKIDSNLWLTGIVQYCEHR